MYYMKHHPIVVHHPYCSGRIEYFLFGSVLNIITAINGNNVASSRQLLIIVIVLCVYEKDRKGGLGWWGWKGNGYFSRVLTWIAAVKLQKFHQLREEQILSDMSVKGV